MADPDDAGGSAGAGGPGAVPGAISPADRGARRGRRPARGAPPGARGGAVCPNLLQRPPSHRRAGGESLIFRASSRGRSRRGAPLQQIWTGSGSGRFRLHPTRPACPISLRSCPSRSLPKRNMALWEDRSGAHPTAAPSKPRNHAEVNGRIRGGGANDPPRTPESGRAVGSDRRRRRLAPARSAPQTLLPGRLRSPAAPV